MKILSLLKFSRVLGLLTLGRALKEGPIIKKLISQITVVIALTALSAMMIGVLFVCALYGIYRAFLYAGVGNDPAIVYTILVAVIITTIIIACTVSAFKKLHKLAKKMNDAGSPITSKARNIAGSFIDGLMTESSVKKEVQADEKRRYYS